LKNGWISLARFDSKGKQLTLDGKTATAENSGYKPSQDDIYWSQTRWTGTNEKGQLELNLEDGYYKIISVNGMNTWYQPYTEFSLASGILKDSSGKTITALNITKPGANMTITVKSSGSSDSMAWLDVMDTTSGNIINVQSDRKDSDGNFIFEERLKNGTYTLAGFYSSSGWSDIETTNFTVPTDGEFTFDFNKESKVIVTGMLYTDSTTIETSKYWIAIQKVENGELVGDKKLVQNENDGKFKFKLSSGETWAVLGITNKDGRKIYSAPKTANTYTILSTPSSQNGWNIIINQIN
jgi:hypothetical protein